MNYVLNKSDRTIEIGGVTIQSGRYAEVDIDVKRPIIKLMISKDLIAVSKEEPKAITPAETGEKDGIMDEVVSELYEANARIEALEKEVENLEKELAAAKKEPKKGSK